MARDSSGTYTRPTGQPVVAGTTISASTHNTLTADLATEITDSLSRSGKGGMTAPLRTADGSVGAPAHSFTSDTDSGLFLNGANNPGMSAGGALIQDWSAAQVTFGKGVVVTGGANQAGGVFTGGATNANGVEGHGVGTGYGVYGSANVAGVYGHTTDNAGVAVKAVVPSGNGQGVNSSTLGAGTAGVFSAAGTGRGLTAAGNPTGAPFRVVPQSAEPSSPAAGDIYYDSDTDKLMLYAAGAWVALN